VIAAATSDLVRRKTGLPYSLAKEEFSAKTRRPAQVGYLEARYSTNGLVVLHLPS